MPEPQPKITRLTRMQYNTYVKKQMKKGKDPISLQDFAKQQGGK